MQNKKTKVRPNVTFITTKMNALKPQRLKLNQEDEDKKTQNRKRNQGLKH